MNQEHEIIITNILRSLIKKSFSFMGPRGVTWDYRINFIDNDLTIDICKLETEIIDGIRYGSSIELFRTLYFRNLIHALRYFIRCGNSIHLPN